MTGQAMRLASGGTIDRSRPLTFEFDGTEYSGFHGDTLASALLANGVRVIGRSFKLHRARGLLGSWSEEPNAIVQVGTGASLTPNLKATQVELHAGLIARSVNNWPSARRDVFAGLQRLARFMPAGFYYKTFMWPHWRWFEPLIRRAAGLGNSPVLPDPDRYEEQHQSCDVLVVGGGPAGISAALAAARAGARVMLADDRPSLGGSLGAQRVEIEGQPERNWVESAARELRGLANVRVLRRATAFGYYDHALVAICQRAPERGSGSQPSDLPREILWHVRPRRIVLATGAIERPIVCPNNDLPGVMLASAAATYVLQFAVRPGHRAVIVTSGDSGYESAAILSAAGIEIVAIVDTRDSASDPGPHVELPQVRVFRGYSPARVIGSTSVRGLWIRRTSRSDISVVSGDAGGSSRDMQRLDCDLLCVSGGWTPTVHLFSQAGGKLRFDAERAALVPDSGPDSLKCVGAAAGQFALEGCLAEGFIAGTQAAAQCGCTQDPGKAPTGACARAMTSAYWGFAAHGDADRPAESSYPDPARSWVDLQNDVTVADLSVAVRENLLSVEHIKRYTTTGMAVDQGKTSNMNALGVIARLSGRTIADLGTTTFRPPYDPVTLGAIAGRRVGQFYQPLRRTPVYRWHVTHRAVMEDFGAWLRPAWYRQPGLARAQCIRLEKRATRTAVSLFDGSSLGKLEVRGPGAARFLDWMYYNTMSTLGVGQARYGLMLNEHGNIIDDGVCMRLGGDHYLVSTTSSGASRIFAQFEDGCQCDWPDLQVLVTNTTCAWGTLAVAGPRARDLVQRLKTDIDLDARAFPHMTVRAGTVEGVPARIARIGFTGEMSFEISVASGCTESLWELLYELGQPLGVAPLGLDALQELRTEKGYLHVGADTDGRTLPADIGLAGVLRRKSSDFIGRRSLDRPDAHTDGRLQFVGIAADDPLCVLPVGAHIVADPLNPSDSQGYITSSCPSEAVGRGVALGLVCSGRERLGAPIHVYSDGQIWRCRIVSPVWYDPNGERLHA